MSAPPKSPPQASVVRRLRARNEVAVIVVLGFVVSTASGLVLATQSGWTYALGQLILGVAFVQWFCLYTKLGMAHSLAPSGGMSVLVIWQDFSHSFHFTHGDSFIMSIIDGPAGRT